MQNTSEFELLSLLVNYPELFERIYVKEEYFVGMEKTMFGILIKEYQKNKALVTESLFTNNRFDANYYVELLNSNMYNSSKENAFIELQKKVIENYKNRKSKELIDNYNGDFNSLYDELAKINDINYNEIEYITAQDMFNELNKSNKKVSTGYPILDSNLNISEHDLVILAGATGGGKTTFALNLLNNMSKNYQCYYFNMEMGKNILYKRLVAMQTGIELKYLNNFDNLTLEQKQKVKDALYEIEKRKIILLNKSQNIADVKKQIANIKNDKHTIVFLDHIGLIKSGGNSLYEKMTNIAKELRSISLDYNCTIIGLCQLSRSSQKNNEVPKLQDLRDSGEIEQSARKTILLHNKTNDVKQRVHEVDVIIAKNDDGNKTVQEFKFDRYTQKFNERYN
jgi:replicative DNA helicase